MILHGLVTHLGRDKTYEKVCSKYFFHNMYKYVKAWVESCPTCQHVKDPSFKTASKSPLGIIETHYPWDLVSIDLWGPVVRSRSGNKYVLTIIDGFSKWADAIPLPD